MKEFLAREKNKRMWEKNNQYKSQTLLNFAEILRFLKLERSKEDKVRFKSEMKEMKKCKFQTRSLF